MGLIAAILLRHQPGFSAALHDPFWRWILLVVMIGTAALVTYPIECAVNKVADNRKKAAAQASILRRLSDLTVHEKKVLQRYLQEQSTVADWGRAIGVVDALARDGIISLLVSCDADTFSHSPDVYSINPVVWKHLHLHPELVDLEPNRPVKPLQL